MGSIEQPKITLVRIAHVYYNHRDLKKAQEFLVDFGFEECHTAGRKSYYRGYSTEPFIYCAQESSEDSFGGAAFVVESEQDLEIATQTLPGATSIYELDDAPGGGKCVTFYDPVDGFPFHLVHGQEPLEEEQLLPEIQFNFVSR
jgi:hypothetical protein